MKSHVLSGQKQMSGLAHVWKQILNSWKRLIHSLSSRFDQKIEIRLSEEDVMLDLHYGVEEHRTECA